MRVLLRRFRCWRAAMGELAAEGESEDDALLPVPILDFSLDTEIGEMLAPWSGDTIRVRRSGGSCPLSPLPRARDGDEGTPNTGAGVRVREPVWPRSRSRSRCLCLFLSLLKPCFLFFAAAGIAPDKAGVTVWELSKVGRGLLVCPLPLVPGWMGGFADSAVGSEARVAALGCRPAEPG